MNGNVTDLPETRLAQAIAPQDSQLRFGGGLTVAAALLWIPQAALVAWLFANLLDGTGDLFTSVAAAGGFTTLGIIRAGLQLHADQRVLDAAHAVLGQERAAIVHREGLRSPMAVGAGSAEVAALAGEKLALIVPYVTRYVPARLRVAVVPAAIVLVCGSMSWVVAVILLVAGPLIPVFMALVGMAAQDASERQMTEIGSLNALLMERLQALVDIRLLDAGSRVAEQFETRADSLRAQTMSVLRIAFLSSTVLELFSAIGVAMVAVFVGFSLLGAIPFGAWGTPLSAGEGVFMLLLVPEFFQPLRDLAAAWHDKAAATAVAMELVALEADRSPTIVGQGVPARAATLQVSRSKLGPEPPLIEVRGSVGETASGAATDYPDIVIRAGESCAIVGPSGSGKSTLLAVMAGLLPATRKKVLIGGQELDGASADAWRLRIAWVPQAPHFFSASLRSNLLLAAPNATDADIVSALKVARADDIVARLPRGQLTMLGEAGAGVSGGEARRLMVARAALGGADVILADEPTANLDSATARAVTEGLLELSRGGATLVVATHDLELAARMDQQVVLGGAA